MTRLPAASAVGAGAGGDTRGPGFVTPALDGMPVMDATEEEQSEPILSDDPFRKGQMFRSLSFPGLPQDLMGHFPHCQLLLSEAYKIFF